jgi:hypothetical protein
MNILLLVSSFLLIFAMISASVLKNALFLEREKKSSYGYMHATAMLQNKYEMYKYKAYHDTAKKKEQASDKASNEIRKPQATFLSHRKEKKPPLAGKLNLAPLLENPKECRSSLLYEATARLLYNLYHHTCFWAQSNQKGLEYALLDAILQTSVHVEDLHSLSQLFPEETKMQPIFYKMLKGTGDYNLKLAHGYPPLSDFLVIDFQEKKAVHFCYASCPVLQAIFPGEIVSQILSIEKKKWEKDYKRHTVTKEELQAILMANSSELKGKSFQDFDAFLNFSKKKIKLETLSYKDADSSVSVSLSLPSS